MVLPRPAIRTERPAVTAGNAGLRAIPQDRHHPAVPGSPVGIGLGGAAGSAF